MSRVKKKYRKKYAKQIKPDVMIIMPKTDGTKVDFSFKKTCHECKHSKLMYDGSEVWCNNKKSKAYDKRVRSWETCKLWQKQ
jgi:hypothetical protein